MKIVLFSFLLLVSNSLSAHQVDISSTMLAETENGSWVLQVRAAMTAFEYEVEHVYPDLKYETPEEFNELVLKLVQDNLQFEINSKEIILTDGMVKLGHETNVVFPLGKIDGDFERFSIVQKMFKDINKSRSALVLMKKGTKAQQFMLDKSNGHTATLQYVKGQFVNTSPNLAKTASMSIWGMIIGVLVLLGGVAFGVGRLKKTTSSI